jgi:hypothetical protein
VFQPPASPFANQPGLAGALGGGRGSVAPNMLGHLLDATKSVQFSIIAPKNILVPGLASTNVLNSNLADNNSPVPQDRLSFRYNYFDRALSVTGAAPPPFNMPGSVPIGSTQTKTYNVNLFTFAVEKTFFDGLVSTELRVPFASTVANTLDLSTGQIQGLIPSSTSLPFGVTPSALHVAYDTNQSLGHEATELQNLSMIFKALLYQNQWLSFSGGLGVEVPTASNTHVNVVDFVGVGTADVFAARLRQFRIKNEIWGLSPFLAALAAPNDRFFTQGFMSLDMPVNEGHVSFAESVPVNVFQTSPNFGLAPPGIPTPFSGADKISEQTLLNLDVGTGYWLVRDPCAQWITGIAPAVELHYTTTLNNADIRTFPIDNVVFPNGAIQPNPRIGNSRNRIDILDVTVGTTVQVGQRATVAGGFSFPLLSGDNRTFDWEFQLQLNYYFGRAATRSAAPTTQQ